MKKRKGLSNRDRIMIGLGAVMLMMFIEFLAALHFVGKRQEDVAHIIMFGMLLTGFCGFFLLRKIIRKYNY